jgi:hypothetical protein
MDDIRKVLLRKLLLDACREVQWGRAGTPVTRLEAAWRTHRLEIDLGDLELVAWVTQNVELAVWVRVARTFSPALEKALVKRIEGTDSLVARLLLVDWPNLRAACESAAGDRPVRTQRGP